MADDEAPAAANKTEPTRKVTVFRVEMPESIASDAKLLIDNVLDDSPIEKDAAQKVKLERCRLNQSALTHHQQHALSDRRSLTRNTGVPGIA